MNHSKLLVISVLLIFLSILAFAQNQTSPGQSRFPDDSLLSIQLQGAGDIPIGKYSGVYGIGATGGAHVRFILPFLPFMSIDADVDYGFNPFVTGQSLSRLTFRGGVGARLPLGRIFEVYAAAEGGGYYGIVSSDYGDFPAFSGIFSAGAGVRIDLQVPISVALQINYKNLFGLYGGLSGHLGISYRIPIRKSGAGAGIIEAGEHEGIDFLRVSADPLFPIMHTYYDDHAFGRVELINIEEEPVSELTVGFFISQYMELPKEISIPGTLAPGGEVAAELYALFSEKILEVSEGTKVPAEIYLEYKIGDRRYHEQQIETIRIYNRNATMWDDDMKAAAFVTAKDPVILKLSKNVAGLVRSGAGIDVSKNLQLGMAMHSALIAQETSYVIDPTTPYADFSQDKFAVDFLQFPRQTLDYRGGDCDDLSILYCALLEAVGVETAFITVPGHIYAAFALEIPSNEAGRKFSQPEDLIFTGSKAWIPVEVTELDGTFLDAWKAGAKQWREYEPKNQAGFLPVHDSWKVYEPVALPGEGEGTSVPDQARINELYSAVFSAFIGREIEPQIAVLQEKIQRSNNNPKYRNSLAVLYARYGQTGKALAALEEIVTDAGDYVPALMNIGNIYFLESQYEKALDYYVTAGNTTPNNAKVILAISRTHHALENFDTAKTTYDRLKELDPDLADRYVYLDSGGGAKDRASDTETIQGGVLWEEE